MTEHRKTPVEKRKGESNFAYMSRLSDERWKQMWADWNERQQRMFERLRPLQDPERSD